MAVVPYVLVGVILVVASLVTLAMWKARTPTVDDSH